VHQLAVARLRAVPARLSSSRLGAPRSCECPMTWGARDRAPWSRARPAWAAAWS
jgi:hypothetical protein